MKSFRIIKPSEMQNKILNSGNVFAFFHRHRKMFPVIAILLHLQKFRNCHLFKKPDITLCFILHWYYAIDIILLNNILIHQSVENLFGVCTCAIKVIIWESNMYIFNNIFWFIAPVFTKHLYNEDFCLETLKAFKLSTVFVFLIDL